MKDISITVYPNNAPVVKYIFKMRKLAVFGVWCLFLLVLAIIIQRNQCQAELNNHFSYAVLENGWIEFSCDIMSSCKSVHKKGEIWLKYDIKECKIKS